MLRVDGGMAASDWTMQRLADILARRSIGPQIKETTALGAAYLAGLHAGLYPPLAEFAPELAARARLPPDACGRHARENGRRLARRGGADADRAQSVAGRRAGFAPTSAGRRPGATIH